MAEKTIKHALFRYRAAKKVTKGEPLNVAFRGSVVNIPHPDDVKKGESIGAFYTDEELEWEDAQPEAEDEGEQGELFDDEGTNGGDDDAKQDAAA